MKIEFRKIPLQESPFNIKADSVEFSGNFSKISSKLAKVDGAICGSYDTQCSKCGVTFSKNTDEKLNLLLSDGIYKSDNDEEDDIIVIEIEDHMVNFDEILHGEIESIKSEYHVCENCTDKEFVEVEY
jgi:uncharacterized metal-binding protein YceD (DUF177 family)